jgi:small subunit ribosomal protein S12
MPTFRQLSKKETTRERKKKKSHVPALKNNPFKIGVVQKRTIQTPKKPNSAKRKVIKVKLSNNKRITAHVPGIGHSLNVFSVVLIRGGRSQDLVGVRYKAVRGKNSLEAPKERKTRPTKYGLPPKKKKKNVFTSSPLI